MNKNSSERPFTQNTDVIACVHSCIFYCVCAKMKSKSLKRFCIEDRIANTRTHVLLNRTKLWLLAVTDIKQKIKFSSNTRYHAEARTKWRYPSPRLSVWATQLRRNVAAMVSRRQHCVRTGLVIEQNLSYQERSALLGMTA